MPADQRLALLVDHLDEIGLFDEAGRFTDGSFVPELEKIGEPAIDKLLEVLESDSRLSRSGALGGGNHQEPLGVEVAAHAALETILSHDFFADEGGREQLAAEDPRLLGASAACRFRALVSNARRRSRRSARGT